MRDVVYDADHDVRSCRYVIVESKILCPNCNVLTAVLAFALPAGYESLCVYDETPDDEIGNWEAPGIAAVLSHVQHLPENVADRIRAVTSLYCLDRDSRTGKTFWMNHCEHCGTQMEEQELHGELDGPFGPTPREGLEGMRLYEMREPFSALAGESHHLIHLNS